MEYLVNRLLERSAVKVARSVLRGAGGAIHRLYPTQDYRILNLAVAAAVNLPEGLCSPFLKKFLLKEIIRLVPLFSVDNSDRENYN